MLSNFIVKHRADSLQKGPGSALVEIVAAKPQTPLPLPLPVLALLVPATAAFKFASSPAEETLLGSPSNQDPSQPGKSSSCGTQVDGGLDREGPRHVKWCTAIHPV